MKKDRVKNPQILSEIAALGHTEYMCIADCGLPIPAGIRVVDISLTAGIPAFTDVLNAVADELVVESYIVAGEIRSQNPAVMEAIESILPGLPCESVPHEEFKRLVGRAKCVIRTGETSPFANILLVGGVNF